MYLFYVVDGLDIKKIEKKRIFLYQTIFSRLFPDNYDFFQFFLRADIILITINATLWSTYINHIY